MRRGRRGRSHLLCPPSPPIDHSGGPEAEPKSGAEPGGQGPEQGRQQNGKRVRARRDRCAGQQASSSCQSRGGRGHGQVAPALRALSGTEELCHRSARSARSQDRCREAVSGRGSCHCAKPVSSLWPRGISTLQSYRICVPRLCFNQSYRESKQRRRHCVADLLGGVRPVRAGRVLQRSSAVLVPFLLRGQVRLPVVLHEPRALERGTAAVPAARASALPKAPRGCGQRREPAQRPGPGHGVRNNEGCATGPGPRPGIRNPGSGGGSPHGPGRRLPAKPEPSAEGQVKLPSRSGMDIPAGEKGHTAGPQLSMEAPPNSLMTETQPSCSSLGKPPSRVTSGHPQSLGGPGSGPRGQLASHSATGSQLPKKAQGPAQGPSNHSSQAPKRPGVSDPPSGPSPPATSNLKPALSQSPSSAPSLPQPLSEPQIQASETSKQPQDKGPTQPAVSSMESELSGPSFSESSQDSTSESTAELTWCWLCYRPHLRCPRHCWLLEHLAY